MSINGHNRIDKRAVRKAFSASADTYDDVAILQREMGLRMVERLDYVRLEPRVILDAGAGTGHCSDLLLQRYNKARIISLDFALPLLKKAAKRGRWLRRPHCLCADLEQLPLADQSVDLVFSNAAIQWCEDLPAALGEFMRVLRGGGLLMFSTFGPDTLKELRAAWAEVDNHVHTSEFVDMHDIGDMMVRAQYADPVMDAEHMTLTYDTVGGLVKDLKSLGAGNAGQQRNRGMTGKQRWQAMQQAYEKFRDNDRLPATYEVVYGHAWRPEKLQLQTMTDTGDVLVPVNLVGKKP